MPNTQTLNPSPRSPSLSHISPPLDGRRRRSLGAPRLLFAPERRLRCPPRRRLRSAPAAPPLRPEAARPLLPQDAGGGELLRGVADADAQRDGGRAHDVDARRLPPWLRLSLRSWQ